MAILFGSNEKFAIYPSDNRIEINWKEFWIFVYHEKKEKGAFHDFIWVERSLFLLFCIFDVKKFKLKRLVCHKKEFPFYKNPFFKGKIRNTFIGHILTLSEKNEL